MLCVHRDTRLLVPSTRDTTDYWQAVAELGVYVHVYHKGGQSRAQLGGHTAVRELQASATGRSSLRTVIRLGKGRGVAEAWKICGQCRARSS